MKKYPKTLHVKQYSTVDAAFTREFDQVVKNAKEEQKFRLQAESMAPNFLHEIAED